jgi:hypothetical protein
LIRTMMKQIKDPRPTSIASIPINPPAISIVLQFFWLVELAAALPSN